MEPCRICNTMSETRYCCYACSQIAREAKERIKEQQAKYDLIIKREEKVMSKVCVDCGAEHNRPKTDRCLKCAKRRQNEQVKKHMKKQREIGKVNRKPCRHCGGKLGPEIPTQSRFCSDICKAEHHGTTVDKIEKIPSTKPKPVDPKWLVRGKINHNTGSSSMGSL